MDAPTSLSEMLAGAPIIDALSEQEQAELLSMIQTTRRSRRKAMLGAVEEALQHLPRLVRPAARKILLG